MYVLPLPPAQARSLLNAAATQKYYCVNMLFFIYLFVFFFFFLIQPGLFCSTDEPRNCWARVLDLSVVSCRLDARKQVHLVFLCEQNVSLLFAQIESNMYS